MAIGHVATVTDAGGITVDFGAGACRYQRGGNTVTSDRGLVNPR